MITWKLVWMKPAELLVNAFWTAKMIVAVKLVAFRLSNMNTRNALARFEIRPLPGNINASGFYVFLKEKCPLGCPCDNYNCDLPERKAILTLYSATQKPPVLIQPNGTFLSMASGLWMIKVLSLKISTSKWTMTHKSICLVPRHWMVKYLFLVVQVQATT